MQAYYRLREIYITEMSHSKIVNTYYLYVDHTIIYNSYRFSNKINLYFSAVKLQYVFDNDKLLLLSTFSFSAPFARRASSQAKDASVQAVLLAFFC